MTRQVFTILITLFLTTGCASIENKSDTNIVTEVDDHIKSSRGFYKTGELKYSYLFENGIRQGTTKEFYKSGELKNEWLYKNGKLDNDSKGYYKSGELKYLYNYINGKKNGITKEYYKDGKLKAEWAYKDGVLH